MKNNLKKMGWALLMALLFYSCKKDAQSSTDLVTDAKAWYEKTTANAVTSLQSNVKTLKPIKQSIEWNSAKVFNLEDGSGVVVVPVSVKTGAGALKGSFTMLLTKNGDKFKPVVAYSEKNNYLTASVSDTDIQEMYKKAVNETARRKKGNPASNKGKLSLLPPSDGGQTCIDWYWTTTVYDQWGNVMDFYETYLYTTCQDNNGGGGGTSDPDPDPNCQASQDVLSGEAVSINVSSTVGPVGSDGYREVRYTWIPFRNVFGLWKFISTEKSREYKAGNEWWFGTIKNESLESDGSFFAATVEYKVLSSDVIILKNQGGIRHHYHYKGNFVCKGFPVEINSNGTVDSPVWTTAN